MSDDRLVPDSGGPVGPGGAGKAPAGSGWGSPPFSSPPSGGAEPGRGPVGPGGAGGAPAGPAGSSTGPGGTPPTSSPPPPPRPDRERRLAAAALVLLVIGAGVWVYLARRAPGPEEQAPVLGRAVIVDEKAPLAEPGKTPERDVVVFFSREGASGLVPERRRIYVTSTITDQAKQVIEELIHGPRRALDVPVLPPETTLRELYLDGEGNAYVDFGSELVQRHPGGTDAELDTLYAVVDSLTWNFPEIKSVQILVDGEERETLAGHLDLTRRYYRDLSRVDPDALEALKSQGGPQARR